MLSSLLIILISSFSFARVDCSRANFIYIQKKVKKTKMIEVCREKKSLLSRNCLKKKCGLRKKKIKGQKYSAYGNPGFRNCMKVGGLPIVGAIRGAKIKRSNKMLCFNKRMNSFVDSKILSTQVELRNAFEQ